MEQEFVGETHHTHRKVKEERHPTMHKTAYVLAHRSRFSCIIIIFITSEEKIATFSQPWSKSLITLYNSLCLKLNTRTTGTLR